MKNKVIRKLTVLLMVPVLYYVVFSGAVEPQNEAVTAAGVSNMTPLLNPSPGGDKNFINCIFNDGYDTSIPGWIENHLNMNMYNDSLHFNTVHLYDKINGDENGTPYYGEFLPNLTQDQITHTNSLLTLTNNKNLKLLFERCKISKLCYAQRLIYEVGNGSTSINNGFCYTGGGGEYTTDSGRTVRKGTDPAQQYPNGYWLSTGIYENLQHSDLYNFNLQYADSGTWYMKPMMRIDSNIVDNYPEKPVVRIVVNNFRGDTIKNVIIKARNFANFDQGSGTYLYNGRYIDVFDFALDPGTSLEISGSDTLDNGLGKGIRAYREEFYKWPTHCKIDFKVYWLGEVTVWFDKMTVDDFYGNKLFDPNPANNFDYNIEQEVDNFADNSGLYSFFADELVYSQFAACRYVDSVMKYHNANARLHIAGSNYLNVLGLKNNLKGYPVLFQTVNPYSFNADAHEVHDLLPYQFIDADPRFPNAWKSTDNDDYNLQLQMKVFGDKNSITEENYFYTHESRYLPSPWGSLVYQIVHTKDQIEDYSQSTKLIMQPQIQMFAYTVNQKFIGNREPTNEEIEAQAMISIAHGADGICWFIYNTAVWPVAQGSQDSFFMMGLLNRWQDGNGPRHSNFYGQDKWDYVRNMNIKIENWKPTLDAIDWQAGYSVHSEYSTGAFTNRVIYNIQSIDPHKTGQNPCVQRLQYHW